MSMKKYSLFITFCVMAYCNLLSKAYAQDSIDYDFRKEDSRFVLEGFSGFEDWGCWTDGEQAEIKFPHPIAN